MLWAIHVNYLIFRQIRLCAIKWRHIEVTKTVQNEGNRSFSGDTVKIKKTLSQWKHIWLSSPLEAHISGTAYRTRVPHFGSLSVYYHNPHYHVVFLHKLRKKKTFKVKLSEQNSQLLLFIQREDSVKSVEFQELLLLLYFLL